MHCWKMFESHRSARVWVEWVDPQPLPLVLTFNFPLSSCELGELNEIKSRVPTQGELSVSLVLKMERAEVNLE